MKLLDAIKDFITDITEEYSNCYWIYKHLGYSNFETRIKSIKETILYMVDMLNPFLL